MSSQDSIEPPVFESKKMVNALLSALTDVSKETLDQYTNKEFLLSLQSEVQQLNGSSCVSSNKVKTSEDSRSTTCDDHFSPSNRVDIDNLVKNLNEVLQGKYFLGRTITSAVLYQSDTVTTIAEDPSGVKAIRICFHNGDLSSLVQELVAGSIVVVSNPWFKVTTHDGGLSLRIDDVSNLSIITENEYRKLIPDLQLKEDTPTSSGDIQNEATENNEDFKKWKRQGNEKFVDKQYIEALRAYNNCLEILPDDLDTLSNRAAVYLRLAWFALALKDTEKVLEIDPGHIKAIYRKTKSLHGLNKCEEATEFLRAQLSHVENERKKQIIVGEMRKSENMEKQKKTGEYDVLNMLRNDGKRIEDCVEYIGPIEIASPPREGRGLIATKFINAGELVMAIRAFEIVFNFNSKSQNLESSKANRKGNEVDDFESESRKELFTAVVNRLKVDPSHGTEFYKLYAGPHLGIPNSDFDHSNVYQKRINAIVSYNSFRSQSSEDDAVFDESFPFGHTKGIWLLASYMNHSCFDHNCVWYTIGDFMFIRAYRSIAPDEELTITYYKPLPEYIERRELIKEYGFSCECRLCNLEPNISEEKVQLRDRIVDGFQRSVQNDTATLRLTLECIEKMKQLVPIETMNLDLLDMYDHLSTLYISEGKYEKSMEQLEKGYRIAKGNPTCCSQAVRFATSIVVLLLKVARKSDVEAALQWVEKLKIDLTIAIGTIDIFKMTQNGKIIVDLMVQNGISF